MDTILMNSNWPSISTKDWLIMNMQEKRWLRNIQISKIIQMRRTLHEFYPDVDWLQVRYNWD